MYVYARNDEQGLKKEGSKNIKKAHLNNIHTRIRHHESYRLLNYISRSFCALHLCKILQAQQLYVDRLQHQRTLWIRFEYAIHLSVAIAITIIECVLTVRHHNNHYCESRSHLPRHILPHSNTYKTHIRVRIVMCIVCDWVSACIFFLRAVHIQQAAS